MSSVKSLRLVEGGLEIALSLNADGAKFSLKPQGALRSQTHWSPWSGFFPGAPEFLAWQLGLRCRRFFADEKEGAPILKPLHIRRVVRVLCRRRNLQLLEQGVAHFHPLAANFVSRHGRTIARVYAPLLLEFDLEDENALIWQHPLVLEALRTLEGILGPESWRLVIGDLSRVPPGFGRHLLERLFQVLDLEVPGSVPADEIEQTARAWRIRLARFATLQSGRGQAIVASWQRLHRNAPNLVKRAPHNLPARGLAFHGARREHPPRTRLGWYVLGTFDAPFFRAPMQPDAVGELLRRNGNPGEAVVGGGFPADQRRLDALRQYILDGREIWDQYCFTPARQHLQPVSGSLSDCYRSARHNHAMLLRDSVFKVALRHFDTAPFEDDVQPVAAVTRARLPNPAPRANAPAEPEWGPAPEPPRGPVRRRRRARPNYRDAELPPDLEALRVKTPYDLVLLGQRCSHCIGSRWGTGHLFFFNGISVCAEVDPVPLRIVMCYDSYNRTTDASRGFHAFVNRRLKEIREALAPVDSPAP